MNFFSCRFTRCFSASSVFSAIPTARSRGRIRIIFDGTNAGKTGKHLEFLHKLFDNAKDRHIMGHNDVPMPAVSDDAVIPLAFVVAACRTSRSPLGKRHRTG